MCSHAIGKAAFKDLIEWQGPSYNPAAEMTHLTGAPRLGPLALIIAVRYTEPVPPT